MQLDPPPQPLQGLLASPLSPAPRGIILWGPGAALP